jgi:thioredoxin-like negative regulator of GroEL
VRRRRPGDGHDRGAAQLTQGPPAGVVDVGAAELEDLLRREDRLVLVDFWTARCQPCRELRPQLERLAAAHPDLCAVVAVDADREPEAVARHRVGEFPTLVFFRQGRELHRFRGGALPASTLDLLDR